MEETTVRNTPTKIYFDGGCRPNPGTMETGVVVRGEFHHQADAGQGSSGQAEWLAMLDALVVARRLGLRDLLLVGDAAGVIDQAAHGGKCRSPVLAAYRDRIHELLQGFERVRVRHVKRTQNLAGIALGQARQGRRISGPRRKEPLE